VSDDHRSLVIVPEDLGQIYQLFLVGPSADLVLQPHGHPERAFLHVLPHVGAHLPHFSRGAEPLVVVTHHGAANGAMAREEEDVHTEGVGVDEVQLPGNLALFLIGVLPRVPSIRSDGHRRDPLIEKIQRGFLSLVIT
jgi:hypothetical protein